MLLLRSRGPILCLAFLVLGVLVAGCGRKGSGKQDEDNSVYLATVYLALLLS